MALNIKDKRTDVLAREVAALTDKTITEAVRETLELRLIALKKAQGKREAHIQSEIRKMQARIAAIPDRDTRSVREISDSLWDDSE